MTLVCFRNAIRADVPAIVALLTDDALGKGREGAAPQAYLDAFDDIAANPMHQLVVGEAVRVAADLRSQGLGALLMAECEARAKAAGCTIIQLTTDRSRQDAHRFYERLGYQPSHIGMKKPL